MSEEQIMSEEEKVLRWQREILLKESDWTQMPDSPLTESKKAEWATYRQVLRDLPENSNPKFAESGVGEMTGFTLPVPPKPKEGGSNEGEQFGQSNFKG